MALPSPDEPAMKTAVWIVFAIIAACWTGLATIAAQGVAWVGTGVAQGAPAVSGMAGDSLTVPAWLALFIDPATWAAAWQAVAVAVEHAAAWMPALGTLIGWLVPLVWLFWGLGLVLLVLLAAVCAWGVGRLAQKPATAPAR